MNYIEKLKILDIEFNLENSIFYFDLQQFAAEDEGRTEEPTEYKKRKAREEGNIPRSNELTAIIVFLLSFWALCIIGESIIKAFYRIMRFYLENVLTYNFSKNSITNFMIDIINLSISSLLPIMITSFIAAIVANISQGGFVFSLKKISFNPGKIFSMMGKNFSRMFWSKETAFNLFKSVMKVFGVFIIGFIIINIRIGEILNLTKMTLVDSMKLLWGILFQYINFSSIYLLILALLDYFFQRNVYIESLKMSKHEIKEEIKEHEGDPEIKAKIRELERRLLNRRMFQEVPKADVVITNPTHIAVALKYDSSYMNAPVVIAKGEGLVAQRIKEIAKENNVFIIENKPLARELYKSVEIGQEIPPELFLAVAKVLSIVYKMRESVAA